MTHFVEDDHNDRIYGPFTTEDAAVTFAHAYERYYRIDPENVHVTAFDQQPLAYVMDTTTRAIRGPQSLVESVQLIISSNNRLVPVRVEELL
jgi:hypothetical protein